MSGLITSLDNIANTTGRTVEEGAKIGENTGKFANVLITGTTENVEAATKLSAAGMTVTTDNLIAVSRLSVIGIDTAKLTLEESRKYITAASELTKSGIDFTTSGVEVAKKQLEAASQLLNTTTNIANTTLGTLGQITDTSLKVASTLSDAIGSLITGSVSAVGDKIKQKQNAYAAANAARQKLLGELNTPDETAKNGVLNKLKNDKIKVFNVIIEGINKDINQLEKTILFSLEQVQKILEQQYKCKIGSLGIIKTKCTNEQENKLNYIEQEVKHVKQGMDGDFLKLRTEIASKTTLFNSELKSMFEKVEDSNKSTLHANIQGLITLHTSTIPDKLTELSNKYNKKIAKLSDSIFGNETYETLASAADTVNDSKKNEKIDATPTKGIVSDRIEKSAMAAGRKQTRRKNRRTKKTSRRHKKRTHKRVHF